MMDAVEFLVTRDRMCKSFNGRCNGCEVKKRMGAGDVCINYMKQHPQEVVEIVERWGKEHPRKTRQSEFLKLFPKGRLMSDGMLKFCPQEVDSGFMCPMIEKKSLGIHCVDCRREYWLSEEDDDGD